MNKIINENALFKLNCPHCGEFITFNSPRDNDEKIWIDDTLGEIKVHNIYTNSGTNGCYESMDTEMMCPRCHYLFKTTVRRNSGII